MPWLLRSRTAAIAAHVDLDVGESLLCAIAISRSGEFVLTGDKRAIAAAEDLVDIVPELDTLRCRLVSLEQVAASLVVYLGERHVAVAICAEPSADRTLSICAGCTRDPDDWFVDADCLTSYIGHLRILAPRMLASSNAPLAST